ncbi:MAG: NAD-dependent epimerase/dehydratase family protein [Deltaproteobacteria bacterium]|nr:NAD-dependent epimerase/dehydratase family protein [bacterium]MCB9479762.1 NAD-dependent epimerase/dehydratase family protein [Deltaproteobacteria bacterium]MCB9487532.1 NAD-dependent epimerase/dehydratase family protein [Deltaproteobacteria bacterium]
MRILVTGCAGFIGSSTAKNLLDAGYDVVGVDCFTDYYARWIKERNLARVLDHPKFTFVEQDINDFDPTAHLGAGDAIVHEAAQAGVRASWGTSFSHYTHNNVSGSQALLERVKDLGLSRFVYAGSSSAYGDALRLPTLESDLPQPISPYGVTKLAGEHLCRTYRVNFGVPCVVVRYFTVYGPHQRPDMAFHKWCKAALANERLPLFGTGEQSRDFTYIDDAVQGTVAAITADGAVGETINIGGGERISVNGTLDLIAKIHGAPLNIDRTDKQKGDVQHTAADVTKAKTILGFEPKVSVADGLREEYAYIKALYDL